MLPKLKISSFLLKRLEQVKQQCSGCLFGVFYGDGTLLLLGFNVESTIGQLNYEQIQYKFPTEVDLCGLVKFGDCTDAEAHVSEIFKDIEISDNPIVLHCELGTLVGLRASIFMHGKEQNVPYEIMQAEQLYRDFFFTRLKCSLLLKTESCVESLRYEMHALRKKLAGGSLAFQVEPAKIFITNSGTHGSGINSDSPICDIIRVVASRVADDNPAAASPPAKGKDAKQLPSLASVYGVVGADYDVLNISVLECKTRERCSGDEASLNGSGGSAGSRGSAGSSSSSSMDGLVDGSASGSSAHTLPAMSMCVQREERKLCIPLDVEAMAILYKDTRVNRLYDILIESMCRSLRLFEQAMTEHMEEQGGGGKTVPLPRIYHFLPQEFGHFLSCSYLDGCGGDDDPTMQERRKRLHRHFGLSVVRPYFRRSNRCRFRSEVSASEPLVNTHVGLKPSGLADGKLYLVQGNYHYYHYMQQAMNDKGWGCAYRSLQTLCSWFQLQGYTERRPPTHREIQEHLVQIGDKPAKFVGSAQWIGSTEVAMCLQGLLAVDSKIVHVPSGGEMATVATDLAMHFQTQGTPVMIGGGVLAHTIIGVDYCPQSGQVKYLILDPHYTGADELATVQAKGWCGWKGGDFWDKRSYYNLCMPQRPMML